MLQRRQSDENLTNENLHLRDFADYSTNRVMQMSAFGKV